MSFKNRQYSGRGGHPATSSNLGLLVFCLVCSFFIGSNVFAVYSVPTLIVAPSSGSTEINITCDDPIYDCWKTYDSNGNMFDGGGDPNCAENHVTYFASDDPLGVYTIAWFNNGNLVVCSDDLPALATLTDAMNYYETRNTYQKFELVDCLTDVDCDDLDPSTTDTCDLATYKCSNVTGSCGDNIKNLSEECDGADGVGEHQICDANCTLSDVPYCGDGSCNNDETCSVCSQDCGSCGGGGGGGGYVYNYSSAMAVTAFDFVDPAIIGVIDESTHSVVLTVSFDTDITNLVPIITVSDKAKISPDSGVAQDFTNLVTYTVTAENGSTQAYTATVVMLGPKEVKGATILRGADPADYGLREGDLIRATGDSDVYIINQYGYKRLFLGPDFFKMYGHINGWEDVITVTSEVRDTFITSTYYRYVDEERVYSLEITGEDAGIMHWINMTSDDFIAQGGDPNSIFIINKSELDWYLKGAEKTSL